MEKTMPHTHQPHTHTPPEQGQKEPEPLVRGLDEVTEKQPKFSQFVIPGVYLLLVLMGGGTGYLLARKVGVGGRGGPATVKTGEEVGIADTKTFRDSAEGIIEKDGVDGEGTHRLIREGGPSQTAYLISSVIDLDQYMGLKVKIWGETFAAQKAGWFMDVGKIEILK